MHNFEAKAKVPLWGTLTIEKIYTDGTSEKVLEEKNVITLAAKQVLLGSLYTPNLVSDPISSLQIGTGGTIDPDGLFPKPVSQALNSLFTPLLSVATSYSIDNSTPAVTYIADIDQATANGQLITEAALYKASNLMFNIKTFPGISKTSNFAIHFSWQIEMA